MNLTNYLTNYLNDIQPVDTAYGDEAQQRENILTKPQGSLGYLEDIAVAVAAMKRQAIPTIKRKAIFTFAGDHGVVEEGVSAFPQEVTPQMVYNFINGGAAINVLARHVDAEVIVADLGVAAQLDIQHSNFKDHKVKPGTANFTKGPAMSKEDAIEAIKRGITIFEEEHAKEPFDLIGTGEMGIGNTTPATAILATISGQNVENIVGRGTGVDDDGLKRKIKAINKGLETNKPNKEDGLDILHKIGGFEIAGLVGVILAAAKHQIPVLIDGFISTAAALIAHTLNPITTQYMLTAHLSQEQGHKAMMKILNKRPILDLGLRLGAGTGAALAMHTVEAAIKILAQMATFADAGVSGKE